MSAKEKTNDTGASGKWLRKLSRRMAGEAENRDEVIEYLREATTRTAISRPLPRRPSAAAAQRFMRARAGAQARVPRASSSLSPRAFMNGRRAHAPHMP